jgi:hypothetical protein
MKQTVSHSLGQFFTKTLNKHVHQHIGNCGNQLDVIQTMLQCSLLMAPIRLHLTFEYARSQTLFNKSERLLVWILGGGVVQHMVGCGMMWQLQVY